MKITYHVDGEWAKVYIGKAVLPFYVAAYPRRIDFYLTLSAIFEEVA